MISANEHANRQAKVVRIADWLTAQLGPGTTENQSFPELARFAAAMNNDQWRKVAGWAGECVPSEPTRRLVVKRLVGTELVMARTPADPFEGIC